MFAYAGLAFSVAVTQAYVLDVSTFEEPPFAMYSVNTKTWSGYNIDMMDYFCACYLCSPSGFHFRQPLTLLTLLGFAPQ